MENKKKKKKKKIPYPVLVTNSITQTSLAQIILSYSIPNNNPKHEMRKKKREKNASPNGKPYLLATLTQQLVPQMPSYRQFIYAPYHPKINVPSNPPSPYSSRHAQSPSIVSTVLFLFFHFPFLLARNSLVTHHCACQIRHSFF